MKIRMIASVMMAIFVSVSLCACQAKGTYDDIKDISVLFAELGDISKVTEAEIDLVYTVESNDMIYAIKNLLIDSVVSEVSFQKDDVLFPPPGAPDYASLLRFYAGDGKELCVYVNDPDLTYDLVCHLYTTPTEETCYCYSLKGSIYQDIKKITHAGEMTDLNNQ